MFKRKKKKNKKGFRALRAPVSQKRKEGILRCKLSVSSVLSIPHKNLGDTNVASAQDGCGQMVILLGRVGVEPTKTPSSNRREIEGENPIRTGSTPTPNPCICKSGVE